MPVTIEKKDEMTGAVKGQKTYETVAERLRKFREKYPISSGWQVVTGLDYDGNAVRCEAHIIDPNGKIVAMGHAEEIRGDGVINATSAVENCETSALGRVLFTAGFGGGEFCSADELLTALQQQKNLKKVEVNLQKEDATQGAESPERSIPDKKASAAGDKSSPPTGKDSEQSWPSGLPDGLPKLDGVKYKRENSHIIAEGSVYKNRQDLKDAGFTFSQPLKKWVYAMQ
ncbi:MAG: hypothetical protein JRE23_08490 [Deltaproteobacteria bacterium]|nr:hypothetical protein [Deltaproteobacteria bacterium]